MCIVISSGTQDVYSARNSVQYTLSVFIHSSQKRKRRDVDAHRRETILM